MGLPPLAIKILNGDVHGDRVQLEADPLNSRLEIQIKVKVRAETELR